MDPGPPTLNNIVPSCAKIAPWSSKYKDEIIQLFKKGIKSAQKIVDILKKKYNK